MGTRNPSFRLAVKSLLLLGVLCFFSETSLFAQDVATGLATATVEAALVVTATAPLAFGSVYQGVPKVVARNTVNSGAFTISGMNNAGISIYLYMPEYLSVEGDSDRMIISFSTTDCTVDTALAASPGDPTGAGIDGYVGIDPHNLPSSVNLSDNGFCGVYLGGKVFPSVDQTPGNYTGSILITVAYTGT